MRARRSSIILGNAQKNTGQWQARGAGWFVKACHKGALPARENVFTSVVTAETRLERPENLPHVRH